MFRIGDMLQHKADRLERQLRCETLDLLEHFDSYTTKNYGSRCEEHEDGCPICEMWARYDSLKEYTK